MISGIMLGIAGATAAVVVADTQQAQIDRQFDLQRSDHVVIKADEPTQAGFASAQIALVRRLPPVSDIGEFSIWSDNENVSRSITSTRAVTAPILVADRRGLDATGTSVTSGANSALLATAESLPVAWVGATLADELGVAPATGSSEVDSQILVRGIPFSVAGVMSNNSGFGYVDGAIVMSRPAAVSTLGGVGTNIRAIAHVRPGAAKAVADYAQRTLDPDGTLMLRDVTPPDGAILLGRVGTDLRRVGIALVGFMGVIGMVTVANTLMMSVYQRQRELGLRSAIGWSRRRIGLLVLTESAVAGVTAGLLGNATGLAAAAAWCWIHGWTLVMPTELPLLLTGAGVAASLLGGLLPALRAASISPLEAMRS